ncbi:hypothetical protein CAPTEDRAFT_200990 [Capitella teleta]|uniref:Uncharacterized protein n=1 Tax=Capitella teleta TaxID=283909 RepID=R7UFE4_CAPTE|nr:hypothetical protein CAPTEDRAFT_200990 [Capitella teleta]|eukprot:ELU02498.1 hypothetical protein CAPTEDRAFT_200990 [Capitella teleta]
MQALKNSLSELAMCAASTKEEEASPRSKLYVSLKNLMSNQYATNGVFNRLLEDLRKDLFPAFVPDFDALPTSEKDQLFSMGMFTCRMHLVINTAPAAVKGLTAFVEAISLLRTQSPDLKLLNKIALELITLELLVLVERQASSQLPEVKYWNPSKELIESTKNVPKTIVMEERNMAVLDNLLRCKLSISAHNLETTLMWWQNKPAGYLEDLTKPQREKLHMEARKKIPQMKCAINKHRKVLREKVEQKLKDKHQKKEKQEVRHINMRLKASREVSSYANLSEILARNDGASEVPAPTLVYKEPQDINQATVEKKRELKLKLEKVKKGRQSS